MLYATGQGNIYGHYYFTLPALNSSVMYGKIILMSVISFVIMYAVMFANVDSADHIYLSLTRLYMSLMMAAPMPLLMLGFMHKMYNNRTKNVMVSLLSVVVFVVSFVFLRNQVFITDRQYMRAMIPHHSSAIMTSKHATITDPAVKKLSEGIIASQEKEISEMKEYLRQMDK